MMNCIVVWVTVPLMESRWIKPSRSSVSSGTWPLGSRSQYSIATFMELIIRPLAPPVWVEKPSTSTTAEAALKFS